MRYYYVCEMEPYHITVVEKNGKITETSFGRLEIKDAVYKETPLLKEAVRQLQQYFVGNRKQFELPLGPEGTPFQQKVWAALLTIPYGETRSYKEIAAQIGNAKACRAVGMANHRNPIGIIIPCHRVIGSSGSLTGYAGGIDKKQLLLELEQRNRLGLFSTGNGAGRGKTGEWE